MALTRAGNTICTTATGTYTPSSSEPLYVAYLLISPSTAGSGTPSATITDAANSPNTKMVLATPNTTTTLLRFEDNPVQFYGGITVSAISGASVTIIFKG
jgi:hypothetical protein